MRDFLEYVEKMKDESPSSLELFTEGFLSDISKIESMDAAKSFILGFLIGKGLDISKNKGVILQFIEDKEQSFSDVNRAIMSNLKFDDEADKGKHIAKLRKSLVQTLAELRKVIKDSKTQDNLKVMRQDRINSVAYAKNVK